MDVTVEYLLQKIGELQVRLDVAVYELEQYQKKDTPTPKNEESTE